MDALEIRLAGPDDLDTLARLVAGFRDHLAARSPSGDEIATHLPIVLADLTIEFQLAWSESGTGDPAWDRAAGEPRRHATGYTQTRFLRSVWSAGLEAVLEDLFVVPEARRRSVGRALLEHAIARATSRGARQLRLSTNDGNLSAHALYREAGFAPVSHALYPDGREVVWGRALDGPGAGEGRTP